MLATRGQVSAVVFSCGLALAAALDCDGSGETAVGHTSGGGTTTSGQGGLAFQDGGPGSGASAGSTSTTGGNGGSGEGGHGTASLELEKAYGATGSIFPRDLAVDSLGHIVVVGALSGSGVTLGGATFDSAGKSDSFIAKYDAQGNHVWSQKHGDGFLQSINGVAIDSQDNIVVVGTNEGVMTIAGQTLDNVGSQFADPFLVKLTPDGKTALVAKSFGIGLGNTDLGASVAVDGNDNILLAGTFQVEISFGGSTLQAAGGSYSMFLAKLQPNGQHLFSKHFGDGQRQDALGVAVALDGSIGLVGTTSGSIDFGDGIHDNTAGARAVVARFDSNGQPQSSHLFPGEGDSAGVAVAFDKAGELYVAGNFAKSIDMGGGAVGSTGGADSAFVARYDTNGNLVYGVRLGEEGIEKVTALAVDPMGYAVVTGHFNKAIEVHAGLTLAAAGGNDGFVIKLAPAGHGFWGATATGADAQEMNAVFADVKGDTYVAGSFNAGVDLGNGPIAAAGGQSLFIARYGP